MRTSTDPVMSCPRCGQPIACFSMDYAYVHRSEHGNPFTGGPAHTIVRGDERPPFGSHPVGRFHDEDVLTLEPCGHELLGTDMDSLIAEIRRREAEAEAKRPPQVGDRIITTEKLRMLPSGSVLLDHDGIVHQRRDGDARDLGYTVGDPTRVWWTAAAEDMPLNTEGIPLPAKVLHVPEES